MPNHEQTAPAERLLAVALFPGATPGEVREVKVQVNDLFGGTPDDCIGGVVRELNQWGSAMLERPDHIVPVQRLIIARRDEAGRLTVKAAELAEKRAAYAATRAAGPALNLLPPRSPLKLAARPAQTPNSEAGAGWLAEHEAKQESEAAA